MSSANVLSSINHQSPVIARRLATNVDVLLLAVLQQGADVCSLAASLDAQPSAQDTFDTVLDEILGRDDAARVRAIANATAVLAAVATGKVIMAKPFAVAWPGDALRDVFGFPDSHSSAVLSQVFHEDTLRGVFESPRAARVPDPNVSPAHVNSVVNFGGSQLVPPNPTQTPPAPAAVAPDKAAPVGANAAPAGKGAGKKSGK